MKRPGGNQREIRDFATEARQTCPRGRDASTFGQTSEVAIVFLPYQFFSSKGRLLVLGVSRCIYRHHYRATVCTLIPGAAWAPNSVDLLRFSRASTSQIHLIRGRVHRHRATSSLLNRRAFRFDAAFAPMLAIK